MIFKRGKFYSYRFKWSVKKPDGTREQFVIQQSARTENKKKAEAVEEEHKHALRLGLIHPRDTWPKPPAPESPTLRDFKKQFLTHTEAHTKSSTHRFYTSCVENLISFAPIADARLSDFNGALATRYANWRRDNEPKPSIQRVNGELRTLRRMMSLAYEWGLTPKPVIIHELAGEEKRERVITQQEEVRYLSAASDTLRDAAILAVDTGLRPNSELFPLEWKNVRLKDVSDDAPNGFIHVPQGKTKAAVRNIPLTARAREVLLRREKEYGKKRYVFPGEGNSGHLVTIQHAHERTIARVNKGIEEEKDKIPPFEFYCWRHTFGTRCAESGMDKFSLARLMGHSSPRVAERYYVHVSEPHVLTNFAKFEAYQERKRAEAFPEMSGAVQ